MSKTKLQNIQSLISDESNMTTELYFIVRELKPGITKSKRIIDKYCFKAQKVFMDTNLKKYFLELIQSKIEQTLSNEDLEVKEYSIIDDDADDRLYTYALNNAVSFCSVINEQLTAGVDIPPANSLKEIKDNLWAYCIKVTNLKASKTFFMFRKLSKSMIVTDESNGIAGRISSYFNTDETRLELIKKETVHFDDKIDCFYYDEDFYVIRKNSFEQLAGLEEDYKQNADNLLEELKTDLTIEGIDILENRYNTSQRALRKLANIAKNNRHKNITPQRLLKMKEIVKSFNLSIKVTDKGFNIDSDIAADELIKLLDKYYLSCLQTDEYFGSFSKTSLQKSS